MKSGIWSGARRLLGITGVAAAGILASASAHAALIPVGLFSFDVGTSTTATLDITNLTGPINGGGSISPLFQVTTQVLFSNLSLVVTFADASTKTFAQSDFTLSADGISWDGPTVALGGSAPVKAVLDGTLSPTSINDGSPETVDSSFVETIITDPAGPLQDQDGAIINASTSTGGGSVPEPGTLALFGSGLLGLGLLCRTGRRRRTSVLRSHLQSAGAACLALVAGVALAPLSASAATTLAAAASPSTGVAGVTFVNLSVGGLPPGTVASSITVAVAPTCALGGSVSGEVTTTASKVTSIFGLTRVQFQVPAALAQATYLVSISGPGFVSTDCSILNVTHSNATLNACLPTSSLAVALGTTVTAYVPNAAWDRSTTGVQAVPIEGGGSPVSIATAAGVNSCSSNPATGETVCTANNTDVYLINGTTLSTTLTSGSTAFAGFSGGECENCGVAINALTNTAYVAMGVSGSPSGDGIQPLNLNTNAFGSPFPTSFSVSENISVDPGRNLILSPDERDVYDLLSLSNAGAITGEFGFSGIGGGGEYDSAAEDCTTGLALSSDEFTNNIILADLSQATFTAGSPGTWTAPTAVPTVVGADGFGYSAGTDGISVAPGGSHLGIVTGEFGGQAFAVLQLPAAAGTGGTPPALVDFAELNTLPNTPDGRSFSAGFDPHTITAYTSPNTGKAMGVIADWDTGTPTFVALIDLQAILSAPRLADGHTVDQTAFDVLASGAVTYIATH